MGLAGESFYQNHLDKVSRSFALCIAELKPPMRAWVGLSYLLCRLVDTVEDANWQDHEQQLRSLAQIQDFVVNGDYENLREWSSQIPPSIPQTEKDLVADALFLFRDLAELPRDVRSPIESTVVRMIGGMSHYLGRKVRSRPTTLAEVNQYCFFVAGIVGELLTELLCVSTSEFKPTAQTWKNSIHFGLFLQKINLLKDQRIDETENRFLIHSRAECLASLRVDAEASLKYLLAIPTSRNDYRLFCAWALFLGLASLPWIEKSWNENAPLKISRLESGILLAKIKLNISSNESMQNLFNQLMTIEKPEKLPEIAAGGQTPEWLVKIYDGRISPREMPEVGLA